MLADFEGDDDEGEGDVSGYNPELTSDNPADYMTEVDGVWFCTICQKRYSEKKTDDTPCTTNSKLYQIPHSKRELHLQSYTVIGRSSNRPNCKRHVEFCHFNKYEGARCLVCHKLFRRKQELRTHYRMKHLAA